jgi:ricin-type beta-trefoil lectin protein
VHVWRATVVIALGILLPFGIGCSVADLVAGGPLDGTEQNGTNDASGTGAGSSLFSVADGPTSDALFNPDALYYPAPTAAVVIENLQNERYLNEELSTTPVDTWSFTGGSNQFWTLWWDSDDDTYQLKNQSSGECLDVIGGATNDGAGVQHYNCWGGDNQRFWIVNFQNNVQIIGKQSGKCLSSASNIDGASAYLWDCSSALSQQWAIAQ